MSSPPDADLLFRAATGLRADAQVLSEEREQLRLETTTLRAADPGPALAALTVRLQALEESLAHREQQMLAVARVLDINGALAALLERAITRIEPFLDQSRIANEALTAFGALGTALDRACAREIERLCTPLLSEPANRLADLPELTPAELHEINLLDASAPIRELAEQHPDLQLLESVEGGLVAAVGDLATADTVTTFVAGVGSADPAGWSTQVNRTRDLAGAAMAPGQRAAGVIWLGYHAPPSVPHAVQRAPAQAAGRELAAFQRELARRYPHQRRVVSGFSYGGVVVGAAAKHGLHADDVVFIAAPGVGADHVDEFTLHGKDPRVHASVSPGDPIGLVTGPTGGIHGPDPAEPAFGANVVDPLVTGDHASYFQDPAFLAAFGNALQTPGNTELVPRRRD